MATSVDYEISEDDQSRIVEFSTVFNKKNMAETRLKALKEQVQNIDDAQEELMINMDTPYLKIGDCFLRLEESELDEHLEAEKKEATDEIRQLEQEIDEHIARTAELKAMLYAKFGNRINLEA
ncbi:KE2 family protein, putative [Babesia bigemina]|uniref:Prefoldin subunit 4 n=1 Tax=Babesia bigemina TaxID=5866 RepID=A0A061D995_BABBI|nr:KE2 family protein, putative [Babesia bigemina]CDR96557.1 KE2 family protein, putative [Babesia bigemina]|eukprot:XP_012768743.1 KE2 family protein, putative [Babesia bigemina]